MSASEVETKSMITNTVASPERKDQIAGGVENRDCVNYYTTIKEVAGAEEDESPLRNQN